MVCVSQFPFQSFTFWIIEGCQPRAYLRLSAPVVSGEDVSEDGAENAPEDAPENAPDAFYTLELVRGSATNPLSAITRELPVAQAVNLRDALQRLGVFDWEQSYGDAAAPGARRWSLSLVFEEGVFALEAKGGSDVPPHFDELLEELYRLDFPRLAGVQGGVRESVRAGTSAGGSPAQGSTAASLGSAIGGAMGMLGVGNIGSMSAGDLGAYAATKGVKNDFSFLRGMFGARGMPEGMSKTDFNFDFDSTANFDGLDADELQRLFSDAERNPQAFQAQMKTIFKTMSPADQNKMLDFLAATGTATREWWERFLRD